MIRDVPESAVPGRVAAGTVRGSVRLTRRPAVVAPLRWLPSAVLAALLIVLIGVIVISGPRSLLWALVILLLVLAAQWLLGTVVRLGGRDSVRPRTTSRRAAWLRPLLALTGAADALPDVDVRQFDVVAVTGAEHRCELVGRPRPAEPREGDIVQVYGRRTGDGAIRVHHMVAADESTTRSRLPAAALAVRVAYVVSIAVSAAGAIAFCWLAL